MEYSAAGKSITWRKTTWLYASLAGGKTEDETPQEQTGTEDLELVLVLAKHHQGGNLTSNDVYGFCTEERTKRKGHLQRDKDIESVAEALNKFIYVWEKEKQEPVEWREIQWAFGMVLLQSWLKRERFC